MQVYQNDHVTISLECHMHLICQTWTGIPTTEAYRAGKLKALELAESHHLKRWLIDQRQVRLVKPKELQWYAQEWLPQAMYRLPHDVRLAIVLSDMNQFSKLGDDLNLRAAFALNPGLQSRYFTNRQEAQTWLLARKSALYQRPTLAYH